MNATECAQLLRAEPNREHGARPANVTLRATWIFEVNQRDASVLLRALRGSLNTEAAEAEAMALAERLERLRVNSTRELLRGIERTAGDPAGAGAY